jgi:hypothetical protein
MSGLQDGPGDYHQDGPADQSIHDSCPKASPWSHLIVASSHRRPRVQAPTKADDHEFQFRVTDSTDITGAQPGVETWCL